MRIVKLGWVYAGRLGRCQRCGWLNFRCDSPNGRMLCSNEKPPNPHGFLRFSYDLRCGISYDLATQKWKLLMFTSRNEQFRFIVSKIPLGRFGAAASFLTTCHQRIFMFFGSALNFSSFAVNFWFRKIKS